jgi:hypothetical protein
VWKAEGSGGSFGEFGKLIAKDAPDTDDDAAAVGGQMLGCLVSLSLFNCFSE